MAKGRYSPEEDRYIVRWLPAVGASLVAMDLSRPTSGVLRRAEKLRICGAWQAYLSEQAATARALQLAGHITDASPFWDETVMDATQ